MFGTDGLEDGLMNHNLLIALLISLRLRKSVKYNNRNLQNLGSGLNEKDNIELKEKNPNWG